MSSPRTSGGRRTRSTRRRRAELDSLTEQLREDEETAATFSAQYAETLR